MYISGNQSDFMSRLHSSVWESGSGQAIINSFKTEASGWWTGIVPATQEQYQAEAQMRLYAYSGLNANALLFNVF